MSWFAKEKHLRGPVFNDYADFINSDMTPVYNLYDTGYSEFYEQEDKALGNVYGASSENKKKISNLRLKSALSEDTAEDNDRVKGDAFYEGIEVEDPIYLTDNQDIVKTSIDSYVAELNRYNYVKKARIQTDLGII
jgi:hypothetical protein